MTNRPVRSKPFKHSLSQWFADPVCHRALKNKHEDNFSSFPHRYLWVNDHKGNGISGRGHYVFCSSVMLGTACTA